AAKDFQADVILVDIELPGMDGYEVARMMRESGIAGDAILVALTGYGQAGDRVRSRDAGFHHHVTKPLHPDALRELLAQVPPRVAAITTGMRLVPAFVTRAVTSHAVDPLPPLAARRTLDNRYSGTTTWKNHCFTKRSNATLSGANGRIVATKSCKTG